jgi:hypothetical protein
MLLGLVAREIADMPTRHFAQAAGWNAISCGMLARDADAAEAILCVDAALRSGRAFYVGTRARGIDSRVWYGLAKADGEAVRFVAYDSDVMGSDLPLVRQSRFSASPCPSPRFVRTPFDLRVACSTVEDDRFRVREWVLPLGNL